MRHARYVRRQHAPQRLEDDGVALTQAMWPNNLGELAHRQPPPAVGESASRGGPQDAARSVRSCSASAKQGVAPI